MKRENSFIRKQYYRIFAGIGLYFTVAVVGEFIDFILAGRLFGEAGVEVIEVVNPLYSFICGFAIMISTGFAALYSHAQGEFNEKRSQCIFSQSIITAAVAGLLVYLGLRALLKSYLRLNGCEGELFDTCFSYGRIFILLALVYPLIYMVNTVAEADGSGMFLAFQAVFSVAVHFTASFFFAKKYGISGLAMGLVTSLTLGLLFSCLHFFSKRNSMKHLSFGFSARDLLDTCIYGSSELMNYVMVTAVDVIMNRFIIKNFGETFLAPYAVVNLVLDMAIIFESCSDAAVPFLGVYYGEKNYRGVVLAMKELLICSLFSGVLFTCVFSLGAKWVPMFYGIHSPGVYEPSVFASAVMGAFGVFIALNYILITGFPYINRTGTSVISGVLHSGVLPLVLGISLGRLRGFSGLVMGLALVPLFTIVIVATALLLREGRKGFPLYLPETGEKQFIFSFDYNEAGKDYLLGAVNQCLRESGADENEIAKTCLLIEEMVIRVIEANVGKTVDGECAIMISGESIRLVLRDTGVVINLTDGDADVSSMNSYVLARLMSRYSIRENLPAISTNRNSVTIPRKQ